MDIDTQLDDIRNQFHELSRQLQIAQQMKDVAAIEHLGQTIRHTRKKQGLTKHNLCELSGISYATLSKIEGGSLSVRLDIVLTLLTTLGLKLWIGRELFISTNDSQES